MNDRLLHTAAILLAAKVSGRGYAHIDPSDREEALDNAQSLIKMRDIKYPPEPQQVNQGATSAAQDAAKAAQEVVQLQSKVFVPSQSGMGWLGVDWEQAPEYAEWWEFNQDTQKGAWGKVDRKEGVILMEAPAFYYRGSVQDSITFRPNHKTKVFEFPLRSEDLKQILCGVIFININGGVWAQLYTAESGSAYSKIPAPPAQNLVLNLRPINWLGVPTIPESMSVVVPCDYDAHNGRVIISGEAIHERKLNILFAVVPN